MLSAVAARLVQPEASGRRLRTAVVAVALPLLVLPAAHPLLLPLVGVPSHLLWFVHVLPVGLVAYACGGSSAGLALLASAAAVAGGERLFGAGYGYGADSATIIALTVAVTATTGLVAAFALWVRAMERRRQALEDETRRSRTLAEIGTTVASIAHEISNPLTAVAGYAELLRTAEVPPAIRADVDVLAHEAARAGRIAQQLLRMTRQGERPREIVRVNRVIECALRARAPSLARHRIALLTALAPELPGVAAVADEIEQVVLNLLTNAEQAMHEAHGQGVLTVATRLEAGRIVVEIADDGPGISAAVLPRLFDAFFSTKPAGTGTGLGLSIARRIARAYGGDLVARANAGPGASFVLSLPVAGSAAAPARDAVRASAG